MTEKIQQLIMDLKKASKLQEDLQTIKTTKLSSPVQELIEYAFKYNILKSSSDVFSVCKELPELEEIITKRYDKKIKDDAASEARYRAQKAEEERKYGGTYDRLEDAPGYGTEWNSRCVPDCVHIRNTSNSRNNRC